MLLGTKLWVCTRRAAACAAHIIGKPGKAVESRCIRWASRPQATVLVGLLQPQPETYDLFDEVILLSSGRVRYCMPRLLTSCAVLGTLRCQLA